MATVLKASINVSRIEKKRIREYNGNKYMDIAIVLFDQPDQWGNDGMIVQEITKEERDSGMKSIILAKIKYPVKKQDQQATQTTTETDTDLPF